MDKRIVWIVGAVSAADLPSLRAFVHAGRGGRGFHALCHHGPSLDGLNDWPAERMDVVGNLADRGYTVEDVAEGLVWAVAAAPSLTATVHCGGDDEAPEVVATVTVAGGEVVVGPPQVPRVRALREGERTDRVADAMIRLLLAPSDPGQGVVGT